MKYVLLPVVLLFLFLASATAQHSKPLVIRDTVVCFDSLSDYHHRLPLKKWKKRWLSEGAYISIFLRKRNGEAIVRFFVKEKLLYTVEYAGDAAPKAERIDVIDINGDVVDSGFTLFYRPTIVRRIYPDTFPVVKYGGKDSLVAITQQQFQAGMPAGKFYKDTTVKKVKHTIRIGTCRMFKDDLSDTGFCKYDYAGDLDTGLVFKVIKQTLYNGEVYVVINRDSCKRYNLSGKPYVFKNMLINFNESETTDRRKYMELWTIINATLQKSGTVSLSENAWFTEVRTNEKGEILMKDTDNKYWKLGKTRLPVYEK